MSRHAHMHINFKTNLLRPHKIYKFSNIVLICKQNSYTYACMCMYNIYMMMRTYIHPMKVLNFLLGQKTFSAQQSFSVYFPVCLRSALLEQRQRKRRAQKFNRQHEITSQGLVVEEFDTLCSNNYLSHWPTQKAGELRLPFSSLPRPN